MIRTTEMEDNLRHQTNLSCTFFVAKDGLLHDDITWAIITDDDEDKEDGCWGMREGETRSQFTSQCPDMWGPVTQSPLLRSPDLLYIRKQSRLNIGDMRLSLRQNPDRPPDDKIK